MILRYEDMALNPEKATRDILQFSGLQFYSEVDEWLMTNAATNSAKDMTDFSEKKFQTYGRNSSETLFKWTEKLTFRNRALSDLI